MLILHRPHQTHCPECHQEYTAVEDVSNASLLTGSGRYKVTVFKHVCINCESEIEYDGLYDHIYWKNENTLWTHDMFNEWTVKRLKSNITLKAFHTAKKCTYYNNGLIKQNGKSEFPSVPTFTEAYEGFIHLQKWIRKLACVYCEQINQLPQIVGMDVTQLCLKYERLQHVVTPRESYKLRKNETIVKMRNIVNKTQMVYIKEKKLRDRAKNYLIGNDVRIYKTDKNVKNIKRYKWNKTKIDKLYNDLRKAGGKDFVDLIQWFLSVRENIKSERLKRLLGDILRALANYVPAYKLSPNPIYELAKDFNLSMMENESLLKDMSRFIPFYVLIHYQLKKETNELISWPPSLTCLIKDMAKRSKHILTTLIEQRYKTNEGKPIVMNDAEKELFSNANACGVSTGLEPHNLRPRYDFVSETDKYKQRKKKKTPRIAGETETELIGQCRKHFDDKVQMSNGTLIANCLQHSLTFAHSHLKSPESVDNYFSFLLMYYPGLDAPSDLITDNPCNILPYLIYREPKKFQNTQNHSDVFHGGAGHACGPLFSSKYWKEGSMDYYRINTS